MKTKTFLVTVITSFLLIGGAGCENETNISDLYHSWKFEGFKYLSNSSFEKADPSDCENCYIFTLSDEGKITGRTSTNTIFGEFQIEKQNMKIINFGGTEINELGNGQKYIETMSLIEKYEISNNELKLYYNQNQNYLLFKLLK